MTVRVVARDEQPGITRVAITGADGTIGTILRDGLSPAFEIIPITREPTALGGRVADLADSGALVSAFQGVDAVVHLAACASVEADWRCVLESNIAGGYNLLEAARAVPSVKRVVVASSNHVTGLFELESGPGLYDIDDDRTLGSDGAPCPDSLYGASKAFIESLGRLYNFMHGLEVIVLRIGTVLPDDDPSSVRGFRLNDSYDFDDRVTRRRTGATWLSHRDCVHLFERALRTDTQWAVVYGTSNNRRQIWSLDSARAIGFSPRDSAPADLFE